MDIIDYYPQNFSMSELVPTRKVPEREKLLKKLEDYLRHGGREKLTIDIGGNRLLIIKGVDEAGSLYFWLTQ